MFKLSKVFVFSWALLWSQLVVGVDLLSIQEQVSELPQEKIEELKDVTVTEGVEKIVEENRFVPLTEEDREVLALMGFSDTEINQMNGLENLALPDNRKKLEKGFVDYTQRKEKEVEDGIMKEAVPGLAASVIGLGFAAFMGLVIGVKCKSQPSALAFAATSAAWIGLELMNWENYKFEMEKLNTLANTEQDLQKANTILSNIENRINTIKPHLKKLESEETADSGLDGIQGELAALKSDVEELKALLIHFDSNQLEALRSLTNSLQAATEVTKKKARNAKIAAVGFTAASGLAVMEGFSVFGGGGNCFTTARNNKYKLFRQSLEVLFPQSFALSISIGDLDKAGIPLGAGGAAAYLAFEGKFLDKIYASGWSRALIFGVMAGTGYYASTKLKKSAEFLAKQTREMRIFTEFFDKRLKQGIIFMDTPIDIIDYAENQLIPKAKELLAEYKEKKETLDTANEVITSIGTVIEDNKDKIDGISDEQLQEIVDFETGDSLEQIQDEIQDSQNTDITTLGTDEFVSYVMPAKKSFIDYLIPVALASTAPGKKIKPSCFVLRPSALKMDPNCNCRKNNSCTQAQFVELNPSKDIKGGNQTLLFAKEVMKANQMILTGKPGEGLARYQKLQKYAPSIEKNTLQLLSKATNKKQSFLPGVKSVHHTVAPAFKGYFGQTGAPQYEKKAIRPQLKASNAKNKHLIEKLRQKLSLIRYLKGEKPKRDDSKLTFKDADFVSPLKEEAIQKDSSLDIFQIIKQRYLKVINDGRL